MTTQEKETTLKELEAGLWATADALRNETSLTAQEYYMPVLGLIFLRHASFRFELVRERLLADPDRPRWKGVPRPVEPVDFEGKAAMFVPEKARYGYLLGLPESEDVCKAVNDAMTALEGVKEVLRGILPKSYDRLGGDLVRGLLRNFADERIARLGDDAFGRIYEYFLGCFAPQVASDDGVFFTPKSIVRLIVEFLEPRKGIVLDPACGSGGMFVSSGDFIADRGGDPNLALQFYGQEKTDTNGRLCLMNMVLHGFDPEKIKYGEGANTFFADAHGLAGRCDYVMANPPFNCHGLKEDAVEKGAAGRLPFGLPGANAKTKILSNGNYLWIQYFYAYLNPTGRAGFVMAASAPDAGGKELEIRRKLVETDHVDAMLGVGNNFFFTKSLPCTLWFFDKAKPAAVRDKVLFLDMRGYFHVVDTTHNDWTPWQIRNIAAIRGLWRGDRARYAALLADYAEAEAAARSAAAAAGDPAALRAEAEAAPRGERKALLARADRADALAADRRAIAEAREWLVSKFGESGEYRDVPGLCKSATLAEIAEKKWSLNPGAYVGVAPREDDGVDFAARMREIHAELLERQRELAALAGKIDADLKEMGL